MIDLLPKEIILQINLYITKKDFMTLTSINKKLNQLNKDHFAWKDRCKIDYKTDYKTVHKHIASTKSQMILRNKYYNFKYYQHLYFNLCVVCTTRTNLKDYFYKHRVCFNCQQYTYKYSTLCKKALKKDYNLNDHEIDSIPNIIIKSKSDKPRIYLFLQSEVDSFIRNKNLLGELKRRKNKKINNAIKKILLKSLKFKILESILYYYYNLDIQTFIPDIIFYSNGLYYDYINKVSFTQNKNVINLLINMFLEIKYLKDHNFFIHNINYTNFSNLLLNILLKDRDTLNTSYSYIEEMKENVIKANEDKFLRKKQLYFYNKLFDLNLNLEDGLSCVNYIYNGYLT